MADNLPTLQPDAVPGMPAAVGLASESLPPGLALMFNPQLFERAKMLAQMLADAEGYTPPHLVGKTAACFAVVTRSLTWRLDPWAVAGATYQTPGGRIGYEGKLCQAILENSGHLVGGVKYEHIGDWSQVAGKYEVKQGNSGKPYAHRTWDRKDTKGLGVIVRAKVKGEAEPREWTFMLDQAFPLNSTLWATDAKTQLCYTAVRRFSNIAVPGLMMGVPFDREDDQDDDPGARARVVSPAPAPAAPQAGGDRLAAVLDSYQPPLATAQPLVPQSPAAEVPPVVADLPPHDADGVVQEEPPAAPQPEPPKPQPEPPASEYEPAPTQVPLDRRATEKVLVTFPAKGGAEGRQIEVSVEEASRQLLAIASQAVGNRGAQWCERVFSLNPWMAADAPTFDQIRSIRDQCLASLKKKGEA